MNIILNDQFMYLIIKIKATLMYINFFSSILKIEYFLHKYIEAF